MKHLLLKFKFSTKFLFNNRTQKDQEDLKCCNGVEVKDMENTLGIVVKKTRRGSIMAIVILFLIIL